MNTKKMRCIKTELSGKRSVRGVLLGGVHDEKRSWKKERNASTIYSGSHGGESQTKLFHKSELTPMEGHKFGVKGGEAPYRRRDSDCVILGALISEKESCKLKGGHGGCSKRRVGKLFRGGGGKRM